jgi:hypothetical protein
MTVKADDLPDRCAIFQENAEHSELLDLPPTGQESGDVSLRSRTAENEEATVVRLLLTASNMLT